MAINRNVRNTYHFEQFEDRKKNEHLQRMVVPPNRSMHPALCVTYSHHYVIVAHPCVPLYRREVLEMLASALQTLHMQWPSDAQRRLGAARSPRAPSWVSVLGGAIRRRLALLPAAVERCSRR